MCGIAGVFFKRQVDRGLLDDRARRLGAPLRHRGPDDAGHWLDPSVGLALAHTRLAIIELSQRGHQPMVSADGRWVISFNGEIYNFPTLAADLEKSGIALRGHSDTEAALEYVARFGLSRALEKFNGMFAIALWDDRDKCLYLVRDRVGIKPLYYGQVNGIWMFASELKALANLPESPTDVDIDSVGVFLRHGYIPDDMCIFSDMRKVRPGTVVRIPMDRGDATVTEYWSLRGRIESRNAATDDIDESAATGVLHDAIRASVEKRLVADVEVGAFLSGGIDSSLVVAAMRECTTTPVRTYTVGFKEKGFDESEYARSVARKLGTRHTEITAGAEDALALVAQLPSVFDEPFADPSQFPTLLVSRLASQEVKVALSGDGGDELFAGYTRYGKVANLWRIMHRIPSGLGKRLMTVQSVLPRYSSFQTKVHRFLMLLGSDTGARFYKNAITMAQNTARIVPRALERDGMFFEVRALGNARSLPEQMMYTDFVTYLPANILTKVDRASMRYSLEARVPLLDHDVVETAWMLPANLRADPRRPKRLLRNVLLRYFDASLFERPKKGFSVPLAAWLRGPLKAWAEELMATCEPDETINLDEVTRCWNAFQNGHDNQAHTIWNVMTFLAWYRAWCDD